MKGTLAEKILKAHVVDGKFEPGAEVGIRIDQTLTQDATGTMAYLQFEAMGLPKVKTELSVSYVDHNTLQTDFMNADDHKYLQSVAAKYGIIFSRPGNGICHQVHLERFGVPGKTLLGSDSHTPTGGGLGMISIGAGGLDVAVAMGGGSFYLKVPKVMGIKLKGRLKPWVSAKDVILEVLRRVDVKGGVGYILEYFGDGVKTLTVPQRATITNMGAETGATTSVFPSDEVTKKFMKSQSRLKQWKALKADKGAEYDEVIEVDLSKVEPLVAQPHSPGKVTTVRELEGMPVDQVAIGSCTNSSYTDLSIVAATLKGKTVSPNTSLCISPGSRQVMNTIAKQSSLSALVLAGARMLECTCGPCIGMGQAPPSAGVSVRTFNRNFEGRSGTKDAKVYLVSPETAAATALKGKLTDPRRLGKYPTVKMPDKFEIDDSMLLKPPKGGKSVEIIRGPNIKPLPIKEELPDTLSGEVLLKVEDNITTDHIMPAGAKILPLRSNIPAISEHVFEQVDKTFAKRAKEKGGGVILGGENYGQGSSREHAALAPMYLGVKAVIAKSFARIHKANLVNFGILPVILKNPADYEKISQGDMLEIPGARKSVEGGSRELKVVNRTKNIEIPVVADYSEREREILSVGGQLNYTKAKAK
ncbi:MAG: aconitate hydratase [archaeon]